ncbi:dihydropteroate synthase [Pimelobacter simplex]|uniref:Dihydropteroate synthase n=1 Tax=Nocardioides simplex TaxID=2045 RepID=A0A0A1DFN0_NOCSI|nr:dihydropteroate synthase [Pimelobacter simplex]AIY16039.1 Dihydropteroate synthase [Pimelobacter simplex]GEB12323.1 dihydropteroate synthase [Pimelobacter simplex]SFM96584.1 dihydropteroate synthase [Pimelobacter simplex]
MTAPPIPLLMGIVNVTPDSFSDGGRYDDPERAIAHGRDLLAQGADVLDVGGESTRPGATRPLLAEELDRVVPVIEALAADGATVSVDTMRAEVAARAVAAGARIVNDVSGGLADPAILDVVASTGATYVAMHWRAHSDRMQQFTGYDEHGGVVPGVRAELAERVAAIRAAGVRDEQIVLDPGLGFAKQPHHNWELVRRLDVLAGLGFPLLVGASRKTFLGRLLADAGGRPRPVAEREAAGIAVTTLLAAGLGGTPVWCLRVHDVRAHRDALAVAAEWGPDADRAADESRGK